MLRLVPDRAALDRMLGKVQALASGRVSKALMPRIARGTVHGLASESKGAQRSPQGRAWPKTRDKAALRWPSSASIRVEVINGKVVATISGPPFVKFQHDGWRKMKVGANGKIRRWKGKARRIVPKKSPPPPWKKKIVAALNAGWRGFMHSANVRAARK